MKKLIPLLLLNILIAGCDNSKEAKLVDFVNPFIGTDAHGHTYPGPLLPFGMVRLSPDTGIEGWDWCSGYHSSDSSIIGFSHTHMSGTGAGDMGDILLMPICGDPAFMSGNKDDPDSGYRSRFSHDSEIATPGYYSVRLDDYGIKVELTASERVGFHQYTFPESQTASILIDLDHGIRDSTVQSQITIHDSIRVSGYRRSTGFIKDHTTYFYAEFSKPFKNFSSYRDGITNNPATYAGRECKVFLHYNTKPGERILVKVGISTVSEQGAKRNIADEIPHWNFRGVIDHATGVWEKMLSVIEVDCPDRDKMAIFYTALYHNLVAPNLISDTDGSYRGWDGKVHAGQRNYYTNFSLWDTYRATHPLLGLLYPEKNNEFINSMLKRFQEIGELPINEYGINETFCMIGHHSIPVIADALLNGYGDFDTVLAYKAVRHSSVTDGFNPKSDWEMYMRYGYLPSDSMVESVSRTLEFNYNDWCVAQMAKYMGKSRDHQYFNERAGFYKNLFDPGTGFMRGRSSVGSWVSPFDPVKVTHAGSEAGSGDYTEANAWQYLWSVPHDVRGLIGLLGGSERFISKLDTLFNLDPVVYGDGSTDDVTGLIGQYAHGNEPCHHVAYLYSYAAAPRKTEEMVNRIKNTLYSNTRDGLCGNDDCGQMSAWYVFSALGFYPVCPGSGYYVIGTPSFNSAKLNLPTGSQFSIKSDISNQDSPHINSVSLNGMNHSGSLLKVGDVLQGGILEFHMESEPQFIAIRFSWSP